MIVDVRLLAFPLIALASPSIAQDREVVFECTDYSDEAPDGCLCLDEDKVLDAVAELKACRKQKSQPPVDMAWIERLAWLFTMAVGALFL